MADAAPVPHHRPTPAAARPPATDPLRRLIECEQLVGLAEAGRSLPGGRGNAHVNPSTVFR
jgi:hypothetical protein